MAINKRFVAKNGLDNNNKTITNVATPVNDTDAANKAYVAPATHVGDTGAAHGVATQSVAGFMSSTDKTKLDGVATGAEVNQNSFSNIAVSGQTTVAADTKTDTLTLVAGTNITITTNAATDSITINANDTSVNWSEIQSKPTTLTGYGITDAAPSSHVGDTGAAHGVATTAVAGFMSSTDKTKLDGIAAGAQVNSVTSVAGKTGAVTLTKSDIGLSNVTNDAQVKKAGDTMSGQLAVEVDSSTPAVRINQIGTGPALLIEDDTSPDATPFVVTSDGDVLIGTANPLEAIPGQIDKLQVYNDGAINKGLSVYAVSDSGLPQIRQLRSRVGNTAVINGDNLGANQWLGYTGAKYVNSAVIRVNVDGEVTADVVPGQIQFLTSWVGNPATRLTIRADGKVGVNTTNPSEILDVFGNVKATSFIGDGSSLQNLNASSVTTGTLSTAVMGSGSASSTTFLRGDGSWATPVDTTYSLATSTVPGLVELGSDTVQSVSANAVTATAARTYALQLNAAGQAVVNVPWTNTTYTAGNGLTLSGTSFALGTPGTLTTTSTNNTTATSHTHAITFPITSVNSKTGDVVLTASDVSAIPSSEKGAANGVATLDASGLVPTSQLPSYVDDVLEYANLAGFPVSGETGKIYVTQDTNKIYRWSGSAYIEISPTAGNADTATKLATARTIALSGDVTGSVSFDGSANVTITTAVGNDSHTHAFANLTSKPTTLSGYGITDAVASNTAITAGTATKITYDAKGLVTAGTTLAATDIPNLDASKITSGTIADARLSGTYSGFTHKIDGVNTVYTTPSNGSSDTKARTVYGLAEYRSAAGAQVGAIVFIAPNTSSTIMHQMEIAGLLYNQHIVSMQVQGYRTSGAWSDTRKISTGTADVMVRWGVTPDGKNCLILGDVTTSWSFPHLSIVRAMFSHTNATDAYCTGWTTAVVTDLSTYTNVTGAIVDSAITGSITGNANTATKLATARTLTIGTTGKDFDGSAAVSWSLAEIGAAASNHTHNYAGSASAGGAANSVANSLVLKFGSGTTEGTDQYTFNGSAAKTVDIKAGTNVTLTETAGAVTISATDTVYTHPTTDGNLHVPPTGTTNGGKVLQAGSTAGSLSWKALEMSDIPGAAFKKSVRVATTAALTVTATTTTLTNSGTLAALVIDGVTLAVNDRVLVKNQATAAQNGIYTVTNAGSASVAWVLTRAADADTSAEISCAIVAIDAGATYGSDLWTNTFKATNTLGTTAMNWYEVVYNSGTWDINTTGSAAKLTTPRALTIGSTAKNFDGSAAVSWSLAEIGAADSSHTHSYLPLTGGTLTGNVSITTAGNAAIELGRIDGTASTPFIDFHSGATATDYDARISASGGNGTAGQGTLTFNASAVLFPDNLKFRIGTSNDSEIYHNGTHTYIDHNVTGDLYIRNQRTGGTIYLQADSTGGTLQNVLQAGVGTDNACSLFANNVARLTTTTSGVSVTGGVTATGVVSASGGVNAGGMAYPIYEANIDFGSDAAGTWRKIVSASLVDSTYSTIAFKIDIVDPNGNHGVPSSVNPDIETYYVACIRTEAATLNTPDNCVVRGPSNRIRAIKTAVGTYEIQIQNETQYREYQIKITPYAFNGNHSVQYFVGSPAGTATATYAASVGSSIDHFENIKVAGQIQSSVATGTAPLVVESTTAVTNLNADLLDGKHAADFAASSHTHSYLPLTGGTLTGTLAIPSGTAAAPGLIFSADTDNGLYLSGTNAIGFSTAGTTSMTLNANGDLSVLGRLRSSGNQSVAAWTTTGVSFDAAAATFTDTSTAAAGTVASRAVSSFNTPTLASTNAITVSNAATVYIANRPTAGTNTTITNGYALWVDNGNCQFDGDVTVNGTLNVRTAIDLADSDEIRIGSSDDAKIYHDGTHTYIDQNVTGDLYIRNQRTGGTIYLQADSTGGTLQNVLQAGVGTDNACVLFANGTTRLTTTTTGVTVTGTAKATSAVFTSPDQIRLKTSDTTTGYGVIHRNDGTNYYILLTNQNDADGTWNTLRPFTINVSTGTVSISNGLTIGKTAVTAPSSSDGNVFSGTYTPTLTSITNIASSSANQCQYMRVGNVVTVSGIVSIAVTTANESSSFEISLPIASGLTTTNVGLAGIISSCEATGSLPWTGTGGIMPNVSTDRAKVVFAPGETDAKLYSFHFTYTIV